MKQESSSMGILRALRNKLILLGIGLHIEHLSVTRDVEWFMKLTIANTLIQFTKCELPSYNRIKNQKYPNKIVRLQSTFSIRQDHHASNFNFSIPDTFSPPKQTTQTPKTPVITTISQSINASSLTSSFPFSLSSFFFPSSFPFSPLSTVCSFFTTTGAGCWPCKPDLSISSSKLLNY